ncbi:uncharacterized protein MELLADRAFT_111502 [Melampsora larici-populina 98AG31]|uniref:Uncharacterized protein n=1 Tax=Melampsora larici-populina (strain 98AG31 / pathotype 3-4-7) TaxID=747676 RepID=F4S3D9_MELLP|nr:uncharacterized protein MELLADRAFT_111502 [Melampsora larici-populina 98AG31]EGG00796.1 hypothetical protein MELLADRAFT_111502 [Melampsora larici-populina 98AG31]
MKTQTNTRPLQYQTKRSLRSNTRIHDQEAPINLLQSSTISSQGSLPSLSILNPLSNLPNLSSNQTSFCVIQKENDSIEQLEFVDEEEEEDEQNKPIPNDDGDTIMEEEEPTSSQHTDPELGATSAFRQASPSSSILFENVSETEAKHQQISLSKYPTISPYKLAHVSQSMTQLSISVLNVLKHYREHLNLWESTSNPTDQVIQASTLIDQCLLRLALLLDPVQYELSQLLYSINGSLLSIDEDVLGDRLCTKNEVECTKFWSRLAELQDKVVKAELRMSDLSVHLSDFYDWTDGCLTPVLGRLSVEEDDLSNQVEESSQRRNLVVSHLLDVQSYFCQALDQISWITKLYRKILTKVLDSIDDFSEAMVNDDRFIDELINWIRLMRSTFKHMADSLLVLSSVANGIETFTSGTIHAVSVSSKPS